MTTFVGMAGPSGAGKTTLAIALCQKYPQSHGLVHLDDYYKKEDEVPKAFNALPDWDHPAALRFDDLLRDLKTLRSGRPITIMTKSEWYHPAYRPELKNRIPYTIQPKPVMVVEGRLALYDLRIVDLLEFGVYLNIPIEKSIGRGSGNKWATGKEYLAKVVVPSHEKFVEPTRAYASLLNARCPQAELFLTFESLLKRRGLL